MRKAANAPPPQALPPGGIWDDALSSCALILALGLPLLLLVIRSRAGTRQPASPSIRVAFSDPSATSRHCSPHGVRQQPSPLAGSLRCRSLDLASAPRVVPSPGRATAAALPATTIAVVPVLASTHPTVAITAPSAPAPAPAPATDPTCHDLQDVQPDNGEVCAESEPSVLCASDDVVLPACAHRPNVSDEERHYMRLLLAVPALRRGAEPYDGALVLGVAREILLTPASDTKRRAADVEVQRRYLGAALEWRDQVDRIRLQPRRLPRPHDCLDDWHLSDGLPIPFPTDVPCVACHRPTYLHEVDCLPGGRPPNAQVE